MLLNAILDTGAVGWNFSRHLGISIQCARIIPNGHKSFTWITAIRAGHCDISVVTRCRLSTSASMIVLCAASGKWRQCVDLYIDIGILRKFRVGWHEKFSPASYTVVRVDGEFVDLKRAFVGTHFVPAVLVTKPKEGGKWPTSWMTYQFRGRGALICVDIHPDRMTLIQRLIFLHEIGHSLFAHNISANLTKSAIFMLPITLVGASIILTPTRILEMSFIVPTATIIVLSLRLSMLHLADVSEELAEEFAFNHFLTHDASTEREIIVQTYVNTMVAAADRRIRQVHLEWLNESLSDGITGDPYVQSKEQWALQAPLPYLVTGSLWCSIVVLGMFVKIQAMWNILLCGLVGFVMPALIISLCYRSFKKLATSCGLQYTLRYTTKGRASLWDVFSPDNVPTVPLS